MTKKTTPEKKHADFQDPYHRSSNFKSVVPKEEFKIKGDGDVALDKDTTKKPSSEK